jgi:hypothetical protein
LRSSPAARAISVNALVIDALMAEVERVKQDDQFLATLLELTERDREILRPFG